MGTLAKYLLCATALAPMLGAFAIREFTVGNQFTSYCLVVATLLLLLIAWLVLRFAHQHAGSTSLEACNMKAADKDVLAFLLTYLLPLLGNQAFVFTNHPAIALYMVVILFAGMAHSNSFHFNPFLTLCLGYHFYEFETLQGSQSILVSKRELANKSDRLHVVKLSRHLYIDVTHEQPA